MIGSTCPLCIVSCSFEAAGHTARVVAPQDVAHAATKTYGITGHHSSFGSLIGYNHTVECIAALVKVECAQVDPCSSAHALVDGKLGCFSLVVDDVFRIGHTLGQTLVAYVDSILACFGQVGLIAYLAMVFLLGGFCLPYSSVGKGILIVFIKSSSGCETYGITVFPFFTIDGLNIIRAFEGIIVVDDHFMLLPVTLTWSEDNGSGILQHGYEVGHHDGLREEVLGSAEEVGALPFPSSLVSVIISSVRRPYREVSVLQSTRYKVGARHVEDPWVSLVVDIFPCSCVAVKVYLARHRLSCDGQGKE